MVAGGLLAVATLLGVAAIGKVSALAAIAQRTAEAAPLELTRAGVAAVDPTVPSNTVQEVLDMLKKENLFAKPAPKQHPVGEVGGILGDEALINGQWYGVGDRIQDATIVAIEPTLIRVEWGGQEKVFAPIGAAASGGPAPVRGPRPTRPGRGEAPSRVDNRGPRQRQAPMFSPEERAALRERVERMTPQEREQFRQEMRERFRSRRR
jgi:hypothetical protein